MKDEVKLEQAHGGAHGGGGCPGSMARSLAPVASAGVVDLRVASELRQWPVQLHLVSPAAPYFQGADLLLASDCSAFARADFHHTFLKGKALAIACPKLDDGQDSYVNKLATMIDQARLNTISVLIMEVPCCGGLVQIAKAALAKAGRKVPIKVVVLSLEGEIKSEDWL